MIVALLLRKTNVDHVMLKSAVVADLSLTGMIRHKKCRGMCVRERRQSDSHAKDPCCAFIPDGKDPQLQQELRKTLTKCFDDTQYFVVPARGSILTQNDSDHITKGMGVSQFVLLMLFKHVILVRLSNYHTPRWASREILASVVRALCSLQCVKVRQATLALA